MLVDTNAYTLQPSLSKRVIADGHGCHTALHFDVKAKENQDKVPTLNWFPKLRIKPYNARFFFLILVLVRQHNFLNCLPRVLQLLKRVIEHCKRYFRDAVKTYFGLLKIQVKF